jgi:hypothetical protein
MARGIKRGGTWVVCLALLALAGGSVRAAAVTETRDFSVLVDGKSTGDAHMTITKYEDGTVTMQGDTDVKVSWLLVNYHYRVRAYEVWKDNKLVRFNSACDDNGKRYVVAAIADGDKIKLSVNKQDRMIRGDVWLTSYWSQPDSKLINQTIPLLDADTGRELEAKLQFIATESRGIAGQTVNVNHFRLNGKVNVDMWYDGSGRLVRQEWIEEGHRTVLELTRLRR